MTRDQIIEQAKQMLSITAKNGGVNSATAWDENFIESSIDTAVGEISAKRPRTNVVSVTFVDDQNDYVLDTTIREVKAVTAKRSGNSTQLTAAFSLDERFDDEWYYDTSDYRPVTLTLSDYVVSNLSSGDTLSLLVVEDWPTPGAESDPNIEAPILNAILKGVVAKTITNRLAKRTASRGLTKDESWLVEAQKSLDKQYQEALDELEIKTPLMVIDLRPQSQQRYAPNYIY